MEKDEAWNRSALIITNRKERNFLPLSEPYLPVKPFPDEPSIGLLSLLMETMYPTYGLSSFQSTAVMWNLALIASIPVLHTVYSLVHSLIEISKSRSYSICTRIRVTRSQGQLIVCSSLSNHSQFPPEVRWSSQGPSARHRLRK